MTGKVTDAANVILLNLPVLIVAETSGVATSIAIKLGDNIFSGAGLLVSIAIIAILIAL